MLTRSGFIKITACVGIVGVICAVGISSSHYNRVEKNIWRGGYSMPTASDIDVAMRRMSITPETLAAAGATAQQTTNLINDLWTTLENEPALIAIEDEGYAAAKQPCDRLIRLVSSGQATQEQINQCQTAIQTLRTAETDRDAVFNTLFTDLASNSSRSSRVTLSTMRGNSHWSVPVEFRAVDHTERNWVLLKRALANERISADLGETPDATDQAFLQNERSNTTISLAKTNLDTNLSTVQAAWNAALARE